MTQPEPSEDLSYEQALELFDAQLRALEDGRLTLEEAIAAVERGHRYLKICEVKLEAARQKIEVRPGTPGEPVAETSPDPFDDPGGDRLL